MAAAEPAARVDRGPLLPGLLEELRHQPGPARLVAGADPGAVVPLEVLVEEDVVPPVGVRLEDLRPAVDRPPPIGPAQEGTGEPPGELGGDVPQGHPAPRVTRELHLERVPEEVVVLLERLDQ